MIIRYDLEDAGWATVTVECAAQKLEMTTSYLHDSLRDLASAVRALLMRASEATVIFMDEPGEHQMTLRNLGDHHVELQILRYEDWQSWGMDCGAGVRRLFGKTSIEELHGQVLSELRRLLDENGQELYLEKWGEPFPIMEMLDLEELE